MTGILTKRIGGQPQSNEIDDTDLHYDVRDTGAAVDSLNLSDGTVFEVAGTKYERDTGLSLADSAFNDLGVAGVKAFGVATPEHYGGDNTGVQDASAAIERALNLGYTVDLGGNNNTWAINDRIGIPDQGLYTPDMYRIVGHGAKVVIGDVDRAFTAAGWKADPSTTDGSIFTSKIEVTGLNFTQSDTGAVIFDADHMYNTRIHHCHFDEIHKIAYSGQQKNAFTEGFMQSFWFDHNIVSQCDWVCDAKLAFNCHFHNNAFENCKRGIYIDGSTQPAINVLCIADNVFEGSVGLFLNLSDYIGLGVQGNYLELNTGGDVDTYGCYIRVDIKSSEFLTGVIHNNRFDLSAAQVADTGFECIKYTNNTIPIANTGISNNWTDGKLVTDDQFISVSGNKANVDVQSPRSAVGARVDYQTNAIAATHATNLDTGVGELTLFKFSLPNFAEESQSRRPFIGNVNCFVQHKTTGSVVVGSDAFLLQLCVQGPEGAGSNDNPWVGVSLVSHTPAPAGQSIDTGVPTANSVTHFTSPAISLTDTGGVYSVAMSGFSTTSVPNYGPASQFSSHVTTELFLRNSSNRIGIGDGLSITS